MNRSILLLLFFFVFITIGFSQNKVLTEKEFTEFYLKKSKSQNPHIDYKVKENLVVIADYKNLKILHFLDNVYLMYLSNPNDLNDIIDNYITASMSSYSSSKSYHLDSLIPIIKPVEYLKSYESETVDYNNDLAFKKYNDDLIILIGYDRKYSTSLLLESDIAEIGISKDSLLTIAINNISSILPEIVIYGDSSRYMITAGGDYELSLLLLDEIWTKEYLPVDGDFVIGIPNKDLLLITGSNTFAKNDRLSELVKSSFESEDYPISPYLYTKKDRKLIRYINR